MPYELSLAPDPDRGGHCYVAVLGPPVGAGDLRELADWIADARQNPDARFVVDMTEAAGISLIARRELRALERRHADLRAERRLTVRRAAAAQTRSSATFLPSRNQILRPSG